MLVFIIPLESQTVSTSWPKVSKLFERTLRSACQQTLSNFHVIVVCHERPDITFTHSRVTYIDVNFPIPDIHSGSKNEILNRKRTDRGRKMLRGLVEAQSFNPTHTMFLDADDCVSNKLAQFIDEHSQSNGYFFTNGYRYRENSKFIYRKLNNFYTMCGSCNIINNRLNQIPDKPEYNHGYGYYNFYIDHAKVPNILAELDTPLEPLPFFGAVYITETGENTYFDTDRLYKGIGKYLNYRLLTPSLRLEFGL
jgi:hypothetical protein